MVRLSYLNATAPILTIWALATGQGTRRLERVARLVDDVRLIVVRYSQRVAYLFSRSMEGIRTALLEITL